MHRVYLVPARLHPRMETTLKQVAKMSVEQQLAFQGIHFIHFGNTGRNRSLLRAELNGFTITLNPSRKLLWTEDLAREFGRTFFYQTRRKSKVPTRLRLTHTFEEEFCRWFQFLWPVTRQGRALEIQELLEGYWKLSPANPNRWKRHGE